MTLDLVGAAALAMAAPGTLYLAALSAASLFHDRRPSVTATPACNHLRITVVVPAHDESLGLARTLRSLAPELAGDPMARLVVVADNCSDDTVDVALACGVDVLERHDPVRRGKGHALRHAFDLLDDADAFIVIDADTDVEPGFLGVMRRRLEAGADALQCRYRVRNALGSRRTALADIAFAAWNVVRPRGRSALGLSAGILGNGFALSRRALARVPYAADSIVEDVEYHHMLLQAGLRVDWVDDTCVRGDMPFVGPAAGQQRARWEGGRLRLLVSRGPSLLHGVLRGNWRLLDALLDLLLWPLAWTVSLLSLAAIAGHGLVQGAAMAGLAIVAAHVGLALAVMPARAGHLRALLGVPVYIVWKLRLAGAAWRASSRHAPWVRSTRTVA